MNGRFGQLAQVLFIGVAASGVFSFVSAMKEGEQRRVCTPLCSLSPDYAARNRLAPEFELKDLTGRPVQLSDYRGKVVVLNFWTKTCAPCLQEMPSLAQLGKVLAAYPDIELLTVTTDESASDASATLSSVLGETANFTTLVDAESDVVRGKYGTKLFPETWILDPDGVIRARIDGPRDWYELAPLVIQFAESISGALSCTVEFENRQAKGSQCEDIPVAG